MEDYIIQLSGLTKKYGPVTVVNQLDLNIRKGEVFGLLGPNGAGKSTTIRMILGMAEPSGGTIKVCGLSPVREPITVKRKVGYLPEDVGFYNNMSGFENLVFSAQLNSIPLKEARNRAKELLELVGLTNESAKKTGIYSRGMRQRLGLADALIKKPEVIILDEPTLGIDPKGVKEFLDLIIRLSKHEGITVLFSSHHLHQVQQVCDRVGIFVKGKLIAEGDLQALSQKLFSSSPYVIEAKILKSNGQDTATLIKQIEVLEGVRKIDVNDNTLTAESTKDVSAEVARQIITGGFDLQSLSHKEFGLDDIYIKYFEGGHDHE